MQNVKQEGKYLDKRKLGELNIVFDFSFILDGFPLTKKHVELLVEKGIIPFKLFELECDVTECTLRAMKDRSDPK